jgi:hypothetical protein
MTFEEYLRDRCGYRALRRLPDERWAALMPFMFTTAIIIVRDGDLHGIDARWCYHTAAAAQAALDAWDGTGEPDGWHRDPMTGRRRGADRPPGVPADAEEWFAP